MVKKRKSECGAASVSRSKKRVRSECRAAREFNELNRGVKRGIARVDGEGCACVYR